MASIAAMASTSRPALVSSSSSSSSSSRVSLRSAAPVRRPAQQQQHQQQQQQARRPLQPPQAMELMQLADLDIDWSDPDTQIGALGAVLGLALGIGAPAFYASRDNRDEERLEELRALNRATKAETGEYMSQDELDAIRPPRWTDRREFVDDD